MLYGLISVIIIKYFVSKYKHFFREKRDFYIENKFYKWKKLLIETNGQLNVCIDDPYIENGDDDDDDDDISMGGGTYLYMGMYSWKDGD